MGRSKSPYEPRPAEGPGAEGFNSSQPTLFYLANDSLIRYWAGLKREAGETISDWFEEVVSPALAAAGGRRGWVDYRFGAGKSGRIKHLAIAPAAMRAPDGRPLASICAGFNPDLEIEGAPIWIGLRCSKSSGGQAIRDQIMADPGRVWRDRKGFNGRNDKDWPIWSNVSGLDEWWTDLGRYQDLTVKHLGVYLKALGDGLESAV
ncbi:hypothetical protein ACE2AJ_09830 [Aquihabitans daechungensis]|uniref:hypothetical protein n=1 Tax=Aquihabitans daechungensis TaxID=1052257 RepID=UPI003BA26CD5